MVNVARESNPQGGDAIQDVVCGLIYAWADAIELGIGLKKGLSDPAEDRSLLLGVKLRW